MHNIVFDHKLDINVQVTYKSIHVCYNLWNRKWDFGYPLFESAGSNFGRNFFKVVESLFK